MKPNKSVARRVFSTFPNRAYAIKPSTTKAFLGLNDPFFWASNDVVFGEVEALHKSVKKNIFAQCPKHQCQARKSHFSQFPAGQQERTPCFTWRVC